MLGTMFYNIMTSWVSSRSEDMASTSDASRLFISQSYFYGLSQMKNEMRSEIK